MEKNENDTVVSTPLEMDTFDPSWSDEGIFQLDVIFYSKKYPERLQPYLLQSLPRVQQLFSPIGFTYTVDPCNKFITVSTTRKEPAVLRRAKDFLQLLAANIPVELAFTLFEDYRLSSCVINIWCLCKDLGISLEQFEERVEIFEKSRRALKELTSCKILMEWYTIVVIGESSAGVKIVMDMVRDCFIFNESPAPKISRAKARKDIDDVRRRLHEMQH